MKKLLIEDGFVWVNDNDKRLIANEEEHPLNEEHLLPPERENGKADNQNELLLPAEFNEPFERKVAGTAESENILMPNTEE